MYWEKLNLSVSRPLLCRYKRSVGFFWFLTKRKKFSRGCGDNSYFNGDRAPMRLKINWQRYLTKYQCIICYLCKGWRVIIGFIVLLKDSVDHELNKHLEMFLSDYPIAIQFRCVALAEWLRHWISSFVNVRTGGPRTKPSHGTHRHGPTQSTAWS